MNYVDVAVEYTPLAVNDARYQAEHFRVGVPVQIGLWKPKNTDIGFLTGLNLRWSVDEGGRGLSLWEVPVEVAFRRYLAPEGASARGFGEIALGPHLALALPDYLPAMPDAAFGVTLGAGGEIGAGDVRALLGARGRLVLSPWDYYGHTISAKGESYTSWSSSDARIEVYAGVSLL